LGPKILEYASKISSYVDEYIYSLVKGEPQTIYEAALHYIKAGGKRLRPLVVVLSARIAGGTVEQALPGAAAVEILHTFTLIHDDIIDRDDVRRGVPTVHKVWGQDLAIVAGDLLFAYAFKSLLKAKEVGVPHERIVKAMEYLTDAAIIVAEGQTEDMLLPSKSNASLDDYLGMIYKKTAHLFAASAGIGAVLGGASELIEKTLVEALKYAGIAFQIRDDILGLVGDEKKLGKPVYSDLREGKRTILVIYALNKCNEIEKRKLLSVLGNRNASIDEFREAAEIIIRSGALDYAEATASSYAEKALSLLSTLKESTKDSEALDMLRELVEYIVVREK